MRAELTFFFRMRKDSGDYWRALPAVGGLKGSRVCTAAAGLIGHVTVTVSIPSLRLALMSDSYIYKIESAHCRMIRSGGVRGRMRNEELWINSFIPIPGLRL